MGRFMSPDWSAKEDPVPYAQIDDPQSLNLYSYVRNNPLSKTDPDGHCPFSFVALPSGVLGLYKGQSQHSEQFKDSSTSKSPTESAIGNAAMCQYGKF